MNTIKQYNKDNSPSRLGVFKAAAFAAGRRSIGKAAYQGPDKLEERGLTTEDIISRGKKRIAKIAIAGTIAGGVAGHLGAELVDKGIAVQERGPVPTQSAPPTDEFLQSSNSGPVVENTNPVSTHTLTSPK